jgi:hypothetical protein
MGKWVVSSGTVDKKGKREEDEKKLQIAKYNASEYKRDWVGMNPKLQFPKLHTR